MSSVRGCENMHTKNLWQRVQNSLLVEFSLLENGELAIGGHWKAVKRWIKLATRSGARLMFPNRGATGRLLVLIPTLNNRRAILPLLARVKSPIWIAGLSMIPERDEALDITHASLISICMIPWAFLNALNLRRDRAGLRHVPIMMLVVMIAQAAGWMIYWRAYFARVRVRGLLVANDHMPITRSVSEAAYAAGVPSIYVQHANVSLDFPPPTAYHLMLLDGPSAIQVYEKLGGAKGQLIAIGAYRLRRSERRGVLNNPPYTIGIGISELVRAQTLESFVSNLFKGSAVKRVLIRAHPAQDISKLSYDFSSFSSYVQLTSGSDCLYESFLDKVDIVIAGNSGIVHDALAYGVPAFYAPLDAARPDYYGFRETKCIRDWDDSVLNESPPSLNLQIRGSLRALEFHDSLAGKSTTEVEAGLSMAAALIEDRVRD